MEDPRCFRRKPRARQETCEETRGRAVHRAAGTNQAISKYLPLESGRVMAVHIVSSIVIAAFLSLILIGLFRRRGPGPCAGFFFVFSTLFLAVWAGGIWLLPVGPPLWGESWLGFVLVGLVFALLLAVALPSRKQPATLDLQHPEVKAASEAAELVFGLFFYLLVIVLIVAIVGRYTWWAR